MMNVFHGKSKLLVSAVAALFAVVTFSAVADDSVKAGGPSDKAGRTIDDSVKAPGKSGKMGRAVDDEAVTSQGMAKKPGRAVDEDVVKSGGGKRQARAIDDVKAGGKTAAVQGRALDEPRKVKKSKKTTSDASRAVQYEPVKTQDSSDRNSDKGARALKK